MTDTMQRGWPLPVRQPPPEDGVVDAVLFRSDDVRIGAFRCPVGHPEFRTAGPIEGYTVVFPRTSVWIQHDGQASFVADPSVAAIYNIGQGYQRFALSPDGDRADWFSVSPRLAASLVQGTLPAAKGRGPSGSPRPFRTAFGPVPAAVYYRQRLLFSRVAAGQLRDRRQIEHEVADLFRAVLLLAQTSRHDDGSAPARRRRDVVERTRAALAASQSGCLTVREVAGRVGVSPYHLCRLFRRYTGHTLHHYQLELRARTALELLQSGPESLSRVAHGIGFSSHSHFTAEFRQRLGLTPSGARRLLGPLAPAPVVGAAPSR